MWPWKSKTPLDMACEKLEAMNRAGHLPAFWKKSFPKSYPPLPENASEEQGEAAIKELLTIAAAEEPYFSRDLLIRLNLPTMEQFTARTGAESRKLSVYIFWFALFTLVAAWIGLYLTCHQDQQAPAPPQPHTPAVSSPAPAISPSTTQAAQPSAAQSGR